MLSTITQHYNGVAWGLVPRAGPVIVLQVPHRARPKIYCHYGRLDELLLDFAHHKGFIVNAYHDDYSLGMVRQNINDYLAGVCALPPPAKKYLLEITSWPEFYRETEIVWEVHCGELHERLRYDLTRGARLYQAQTTGENSYGLQPLPAGQAERFFNGPEAVLDYLVTTGCRDSGILIHDEAIAKYLNDNTGGLTKAKKSIQENLRRQVIEFISAREEIFVCSRAALRAANLSKSPVHG